MPCDRTPGDDLITIVVSIPATTRYYQLWPRDRSAKLWPNDTHCLRWEVIQTDVLVDRPDSTFSRNPKIVIVALLWHSITNLGVWRTKIPQLRGNRGW